MFSWVWRLGHCKLEGTKIERGGKDHAVAKMHSCKMRLSVLAAGPCSILSLMFGEWRLGRRVWGWKSLSHLQRLHRRCPECVPWTVPVPQPSGLWRHPHWTGITISVSSRPPRLLWFKTHTQREARIHINLTVITSHYIKNFIFWDVFAKGRAPLESNYSHPWQGMWRLTTPFHI